MINGIWGACVDQQLPQRPGRQGRFLGRASPLPACAGGAIWHWTAPGGKPRLATSWVGRCKPWARRWRCRWTGALWFAAACQAWRCRARGVLLAAACRGEPGGGPSSASAKGGGDRNLPCKGAPRADTIWLCAGDSAGRTCFGWYIVSSFLPRCPSPREISITRFGSGKRDWVSEEGRGKVWAPEKNTPQGGARCQHRYLLRIIWCKWRPTERPGNQVIAFNR